MSGQRDVEAHRGDDFYTSEFDDKIKRNIFIRKVYGVVSLQLLFSAAVSAVFLYVNGIREFFLAHSWPTVLAVIFYVSTSFALCCFDILRRCSPMNYEVFVFFTILLTFLCASLTAAFQIEAIYIAMSATGGVCFVIAVFASQNKWSVTLNGSLLFAMIWISSIASVGIIYFQNYLFNILYGCLGGISFSWYLLFDIHRLMSDKKNLVRDNEYIYAALSLYTDVLFLCENILLLIEQLQS